MYLASDESSARCAVDEESDKTSSYLKTFVRRCQGEKRPVSVGAKETQR